MIRFGPRDIRRRHLPSVALNQTRQDLEAETIAPLEARATRLNLDPLADRVVARRHVRYIDGMPAIISDDCCGPGYAWGARGAGSVAPVVADAIDDLDRALVHAVQVDGRAPFRRIGEVLGVSDQTVARRYARSRDSYGLRVVALTHPAVLGDRQWMLRIRATPGAAAKIADALAKRSDTGWISLCSGGRDRRLCVRRRCPCSGRGPATNGRCQPPDARRAAL